MDEKLYSISEVADAFALSVPTLRYYEELGVITATARRGRVRHYDRATLEWLAYAQLWHEDGRMSLADTLRILGSERVVDRGDLIRDELAAIDDRIARLQRARTVLDHMLGCETDEPLACAWTGGYIRRRVDAALAGREPADDFFPPNSVPPE